MMLFGDNVSSPPISSFRYLRLRHKPESKRGQNNGETNIDVTIPVPLTNNHPPPFVRLPRFLARSFYLGVCCSDRRRTRPRASLRMGEARVSVYVYVALLRF